MSSDEVLFCFGAATIRCDEEPGGLTGPPFRLPIRFDPAYAFPELGTLWCTVLDPYGPDAALLDVWLPLCPDY